MSVITLKNVRLSFPQLWTPKAFTEGQTPKFNANFLLDKSKHQDQIADFKKEIKKAVVATWANKVPSNLQICLGDGAEKSHDGYEDTMYISASNRNRPTIIDRDRTPLVEEDGRVYAGCYVNAAVSLWVLNKPFGKRVCANLEAIQFVKDGEPFGAARPDTNALFDDISAEQDADADDDFLAA